MTSRTPPAAPTPTSVNDSAGVALLPVLTGGAEEEEEEEEGFCVGAAVGAKVGVLSVT